MPTRPRDTKRKDSPSHRRSRSAFSLFLFPHFSAFHVTDLCVDLYPLERRALLPSPLFRVAIERSLCHSPSLFFLPISCSSRQLASFLVRLSASPRRMSSAAFKTAHPHTKAHKQRPTVAFINVWPRGKEGNCKQEEGTKEATKIEMALRALVKSPFILNLKWSFVPTRTRRPLFFCSPESGLNVPFLPFFPHSKFPLSLPHASFFQWILLSFRVFQ